MKIEDLFLNEAFDNPYPITKSGKDGTTVEFFEFDADGTQFSVYIDEPYGDHTGGLPEVMFSNRAGGGHKVSLTNVFANEGVVPMRVFATVMAALRRSHFVRKYKGFFMSATESHRARLYERMLKVMRMRYNKGFHADRGYTFQVRI